MPWKRKRMFSRGRRVPCIALADKYSAYKSLLGGRSAEETKAALEKRGISVP